MKTDIYIIYNYFKYILINLSIFIGIIWLSQIMRIIDLQYSISIQILDVLKSTFFILPSFINPLVPFLILLGCMVVNFNIKNNSEIIIINQYFSKKKIRKISLVIFFLILSIYTINNEIISKKSYSIYKLKELEIRNNLKLGSPSINEFHIDNIISLFFDEKEDDTFYNVEAIIYEQNQFIKAEAVDIELSNESFNLVFLNGERLILNNLEKSKTNFDKFTFPLKEKRVEKLLYDKDHFNTYGLINHKEKDYKIYGHNKIIKYFFLILNILISLKIIFYFKIEKKSIHRFLIIFLIMLIIEILNSFFNYLFINKEVFNLINYYILNILIGFLYFFYSNRLLK